MSVANAFLTESPRTQNGDRFITKKHEKEMMPYLSFPPPISPNTPSVGMYSPTQNKLYDSLTVDTGFIQTTPARMLIVDLFQGVGGAGERPCVRSFMYMGAEEKSVTYMYTFVHD